MYSFIHRMIRPFPLIRRPGILRLVEPFGLLPSLDSGELGARAQLTSRTAVRCYFL